VAKKLLTTGRGTAVYPWLTGKPDTKYKDEGVYKTGLRLKRDDPKCVELMGLIDEGMKTALKEAKEKAENAKERNKVKSCEDKPYSIETDDDDNETGFVVFNFKMKASGINKKTNEAWTRKPALFDKAGSVLPPETKVGGGSTIRVSFTLGTFFTIKLGAGVTLRLEGVQVLTLVEWSADASKFGFENESEEDEDTETAEAGDDADEEDEEKPAVKASGKKTAAKDADEDDEF
jgi:hypothetical protein